MGERILIVTSHTEFGETLRLSLEEDGGYQVHYAQIASDAIQAARRQDFFLAILDAENIDFTIQKMVASLRNVIPDLRIIAIPPFNDADHPSMQGIRIDGYLNRPFFTPDLITQVNELASQMKEREPTKKEEPAARPKLTKEDLLRELDHFFNWMDKPLASKAEEKKSEPERGINQEQTSKDSSHGEQKGEAQKSEEHIEITDESEEEKIHFTPDKPQSAKERMEQNLQPEWMMEDDMEEKKRPESEDEIIEDLLAQLAAQSMPETEEGEEAGKVLPTSEKPGHPKAESGASKEVEELPDWLLDDMDEGLETEETPASKGQQPEGTAPRQSKESWEYLEPADEAQSIEKLKQAIIDQNGPYASQQLGYLAQKDAVPGIVLLWSEKIWAHTGLLQKADLEVIEQILSSGHHEGENVDLARFVRLGTLNEKFLIYATTVQPGLTLCEAYHAGKPLSKIRKHTIELARQLTVEITEFPEEPGDIHPSETELPVSKEEEPEISRDFEKEIEETELKDMMAGIEEELAIEHVMMGDEWVYDIPEEPVPFELEEEAVHAEVSDKSGSEKEIVTEEGSGKMKEESPSQERYFGPKGGQKLLTNQVEPPDKASLFVFQNGHKHAMAKFNKIAETQGDKEPTRVFNAEEYADYRAQKDAEDVLAKVREQLKNQRPPAPALKSFYLAIEAEYYQSLVGQNQNDREIKSAEAQVMEMIQEVDEAQAELQAAPPEEQQVLEEELEGIPAKIEEGEIPEAPEVEEGVESKEISEEEGVSPEVEAALETELAAELMEEVEPKDEGEALIEEETLPVEKGEEPAEEVTPTIQPSETEMAEESAPAEVMEEPESALESVVAEADLEEEPEMEEKGTEKQLEEMLQGILEDLEMAVPPEVQLEEKPAEIESQEELPEEPGEEVAQDTQDAEEQVRILDEELDLLEPLRARTGKQAEDFEFDIDVDTFFEDYMAEVGEPITPDELSSAVEDESTTPITKEQPEEEGEEEEILPKISEEDKDAEANLDAQTAEGLETAHMEEVSPEEPPEPSFEESMGGVEEPPAEEEPEWIQETPEDQAVVEMEEIAAEREEVGEIEEAAVEEVTAEFEETVEEEVPSEPGEPLEEVDFIEMDEPVPKEEPAETEESTGEEESLEDVESPVQEELEERESSAAEIGWSEEEPVLPEEQKGEETDSEESTFLKDMRDQITESEQAEKEGKKLDLDEDLNALLISLNETRAEEPESPPEGESFKPPFDTEDLGDLFSEEEKGEDLITTKEETVIQEEGIEALSGDQEETWETITEEETAKQAEIETQRIIEDILTQPDEELEDFPPSGSFEQAIEDLQTLDTDEQEEQRGIEEDEFSATIITGETDQYGDKLAEDSSEQAASADIASDQVIEKGLYPWEKEVPQDSEATPTPHAGLDESAPGGLLDLMTDLEGAPVLQEKDNPAYTCILVPDLGEFSLSSEITDRLVEWMPKLCQAYGWQLEKLSIQPTYMQWTVRVNPGISQGFIVRKIRLQTSIRMFDEFPELRKDNQSGNFWAKGYLVVSGSEPPPAELLDDFIQRNSHPRDSSSPQFIES